ncbi:MAG: hypothetical protein B7Y25_06560 [Alphaproteobacteria bacterium 16-39-46]|nr:MAG: hypothetical protein B7Y25_06560 [Alphaproteobacteria bacterium 16-39-46]OZA42263.1 MAG: hypothetical protein B7X84_06635 [Alphaproteobacteria bacterium 17-39-52]HQS84544.1 lasso peptide biosynthesis B2 protein [Alphaproteobacteria bacterium]HQS94345.1 lasso peptide biosynthesis B2 protein [Alphaproteobacteria bacterium]
MYYHLKEHIYITQFREELILLNTKSDKYTICFKELSDLLKTLLEKESASFLTPHTSQNLPYIQHLLEDDVIEKKKALYPFYIDRKTASEGVSNVDWQLPLETKKVHISFEVLKAFITLININFYIKFRGLYATILLIKKSHKSKSNYIIPQEEDLRDLANVVNKACLMYPTRIKCLEWAMTFVLLALRKKWKCNLEIGIQNYPFFAHAWVECGGKVVMDSQDLREGLAIILNEPFRRIKS